MATGHPPANEGALLEASPFRSPSGPLPTAGSPTAGSPTAGPEEVARNALRRSEPGEVFVSNSGMLPIMRRPRFWAWTLTLTAALLAVVWVGSMKVSVWVRVTPYTGFSMAGGACVITNVEYAGKTATSVAHLGPSSVEMIDWIVVPGFASDTLSYQGERAITYWVPLWPFVLLTGVPGVWMLIKTRQRTNPHACPACGYDRTGLPQSPTGPAPCPECGKGAGTSSL